MESIIKNKLRDIEQSQQIKIVYACETGSRAWGFPSTDSDYDVRLIYMHEPDWYLSLSEKKDTLEFMSDDGMLDITGWDIKKCLKLLWRSNGALLERIQSPIVYIEQNNIASLLREYAVLCFIPLATMYHYLGLAKNSFAEIEEKEEIKLKKLFYALRAALACKWIFEKDSIPPIVFSTMVDELSFETGLKNKIKLLVDLKFTKTESYMHPKEEEFNFFIKSEIQNAGNLAEHIRGRRDRKVDLDALFRQIIKTF